MGQDKVAANLSSRIVYYLTDKMNSGAGIIKASKASRRYRGDRGGGLGRDRALFKLFWIRLNIWARGARLGEKVIDATDSASVASMERQRCTGESDASITF